MKNIGFIGAGKVACMMGKYFLERGIQVSGYYDVSRVCADEAATYTGSKVYDDMECLVADSFLFFISTPDDIIKNVWDKVKSLDIRGKIVGIFSGSVSSEVFTGIDTTGAYGVSVHPMYAFSDRFSNTEQLHTVKFTIEGDEYACGYVRDLLEGLGHRVCEISPEKKIRYHAAASVVSNLMVGLYDMGVEMLLDCGFDESSAAEYAAPLVRNNIESVIKTSPVEALTGPIERGDAGTVRHHLEALTPDEREVYLPLARRLIQIAAKKNPERDYSELRQILEQI